MSEKFPKQWEFWQKQVAPTLNKIIHRFHRSISVNQFIALSKSVIKFIYYWEVLDTSCPKFKGHSKPLLKIVDEKNDPVSKESRFPFKPLGNKNLCCLSFTKTKLTKLGQYLNNHKLILMTNLFCMIGFVLTLSAVTAGY